MNKTKQMIRRTIFRPTSDGAAAVILCSDAYLNSHAHLKPQAVEILGMQLATDLPSAFEKSVINMVAPF